MRFVAAVKSNIKRGCAVVLGPKTLIVGPNGAGKSTIVNAIELATTGRASDVAGRVTLAKDTELATLIRFGDAAGSASVTIDDGSAATWALTPGAKAARSGVEAEFPLRDVRDNLTGSPETARKWLLGHVAKGMEWAGVLASIPAALHSRVSTLAGGLVLGLPTALETAKAKAREETKRAADLKEAATLASTGLPPPLTEAEIEAAKLDASVQAREMLAQVRERGRAGVARKTEAEAAVKTAADALAALPPPAKIAEVGGAMLAVLEGQIETGAKACGICGGATDAKKAATRRDQINGVIKLACIVEAQRGEQMAALNAAKARLTAEQASLVGLAAEVARLNALIDATPEPAIVAERRGRWQAVQDQQAGALAAQRTVAEWLELAEALAEAVSRIVDGGRVAFESRVQAFMPAGYIFGLEITDTSVRYGLRDGGALKSALSGAEWAIVTAALAAAVIQPDRLNVVVPDDRPFDPATLAATMTAFGRIDAQVIIATPTMPTAAPEGWTVIAVGGPIAKAAPAPAPVAQATIAPVAAPASGKKRGRPSKADLAARAGAASVSATLAVLAPVAAVEASPMEPHEFPQKCEGCDVREDLPPHLHSKSCTIHGGVTYVIVDGKKVSDLIADAASAQLDIASLFE